MMNKQKIIFTLLLIVFLSAFAKAEEIASPIFWMVKPVVLKASEFPELVGTPREKIAAFSCKESDSVSAPIPFQVDPRNKDGNFILGKTGTIDNEVAPPGPLQKQDEIVFMANDAGLRCMTDLKIAKPFEVEIESPDGAKRYVYIGEWTSDKPPRSDKDYVSYDIKPEIEALRTDIYTQTFKPGELFLSGLMISPKGGGNGKDVFDRLKLRTSLTVVGGFTMSFDESGFASSLSGVRDGPVRVIRRNETALELFFGLKTPTVDVDALFYSNSYEVPATLKIPFRADLVISDMAYMQGCDLSHKAGPFDYYPDIYPEGVVIDGKMSEAEKALNESPEEHRGGIISGEAGTMAYIARWTDQSLPVKIGLYYADDKDAIDEPEDEPGLAMYGFKLRNPLELAKKSSDLNIIVYIFPELNDRPMEILKQVDYEADVMVSSLGQ
jgi:hypothetical protein